MARIFMSYRRVDSISESGRIHDHLEREFGGKNVFKDVDDIEPGKDFRKVIEDEIIHCDVFLAIIGPKWSSIASADDKARLFDPNDFVRIEVETGLARPEVLVVPVLVNGAIMPSTSELPESLRELTYRNAVTIRNDPDFSRDIGRLIQYIHHYRDQKRPVKTRLPRATIGIGALAIIITVLIIGTLLSQIPPKPETTTESQTTVINNTPTPAPEIDNRDAQALLLEAQTIAGNADYEAAIDIYSQLIEQDANFAQAYFGRGLAYVSGFGNYEAGIADLKQAIILDPNYGEAFAYLGTYQYQNSEYEDVELNLSRAIDLNPNDTQARTVLGEYYLNVGQADKANEQYDALIELMSDDPPALYEAWLSKGYAYEALGSADEALIAYETARDINPDNSRAYFLLGNLYAYLANYESALENLDIALERGEADSDLYFVRGISNRELGNPSDAITDFDRALQFSPGNLNIYVQRGRTYFELKEYLSAIADLSQAITRDSTLTEAYYYRGLTYNDLEDWDAALADFSTLIEMNSGFVSESYVYRGLIYAQLDQNEEALSNLINGIEYGVDDENLYYDALIELGWVKLSLEDYGGALEQFTLAMNFAPEKADAYEGQANVFIEQAESADSNTGAQSAWISAIESLNRGLDAAGDSADLYYNRGYAQLELTLLNESEDLESAENDFDQALELDEEYALAYAHLADIYLIYGDTYIERALTYAQQADTYNEDDDPYIDYVLGKAYEANDDIESAIEAYQTAIDNGLENPEFHQQHIEELRADEDD